MTVSNIPTAVGPVRNAQTASLATSTSVAVRGKCAGGPRYVEKTGIKSQIVAGREVRAKGS